MGHARGRGAELRVIADALESERHVVVAGEAGIGKSLLWREALARLGARRTLRAVATTTTRAIPLGALATVLRSPAGIDSPDPLERLVAAIDTLRAEPDRPVLAVDDAHLLDDLSAAIVGHVALEGLATLILTVRDGVQVPDAIRRLWKDDLASVVALGPLDAPAVGAAIEDLVGSPVEARTHARLHDASGGNPLFLRELVLAGLDQGAFTDVGGVLSWSGELRGGPTLAEVIAARLGGLDPGVRECAEVVAVAGPVPAAILERVCLPLVVAAALRAGAVRTRVENARAVIEPGHPLYAPVLLSQTSTARTAAILDVLIDAALTRGARDRADEARLASWLVARADHSHPELLLTAARRAFDATDVHIAERLASAAADAGAGADAERLLRRIGAVLGRVSTPPTDTRVKGDEATIVQQAMAEADRFFFGFADAASALTSLRHAALELPPGRVRAELDAVALGVRLHGGEPAGSVVADGLRMLSCDQHPAVVLRAALATGPALAVTGRTVEAVAILEQGRAAIPDAGVARFLGDQVCFTLAQVLVYRGHLAAAEQLAREGHADSVADDDVPSRIGWAIVLGQVDLWRGRPRSAARRFGEALAIMGDIDLVGYRVRCRADAAHALAWAGELPPGEVLPEVPAGGSHGAFFAPLVLLSLAERHAAAGQLAVAERLAAEAAARAEQAEQSRVAALALHVAVRVRPSKRTAARVRRLLAGAKGNLAPLLTDSAAALAHDDGAALEAIASRWEEFGAGAAAAEYLVRAAAAFDAAGSHAAARRCRANGLERAALLEAPPPLARMPESGPALTAREHEVASLAATGLTNGEIAEQLGVSVRTVHTHLQVAYRKLGMNCRGRLAELLG